MVPMRWATRADIAAAAKDHKGNGQHTYAGLEWGVALHSLKILAHEEHGPHQSKGNQREGDIGSAEGHVLEEGYRQHGIRRTPFPIGECAQEHHRGTESIEDVVSRPATLPGLNDAIHQREESGNREYRPRKVNLAGMLIPGIMDEDVSAGQGDYYNRQIDVEHGAPTEVFQKPPSNKRSNAQPQRKDRGPESDGLAALLGIAEGGRQNRERGGHDHGTAYTHYGAHGDEHYRRPGKRCTQRETTEDYQACLQRFLSTYTVADRTHRQQQCCEDQYIGINDPLQSTGRRAQLIGYGRQSQVQYSIVQSDDQQRETQEPQGNPPPLVPRRLLHQVKLLSICSSQYLTQPSTGLPSLSSNQVQNTEKIHLR